MQIDMNKMERAKNGDAKALSILMRQHAPLVQSLAKRFEQVQDAFQAGCIGLIKAIRGYSAEKGFAFSTYAVPVILGEMRKVRNKRFGWRTERKIRAINLFRNKTMNEKGRDATILEIAEETGMDAAEIALLMEESKQVLYYDDASMNPAVMADPKSERWMQQLFVRDILERMPGTYSYILKHRFMLCESQRELSGKMRMHQSSLSRTEKKARLMFITAWQE